ncbi:MAG: sigma 54-interacting transcriptional regulator [Proteobacteria bacterium]|nr:sigma 54-interacting transcriptional regulator [Pseudomonadota bacterium]
MAPIESLFSDALRRYTRIRSLGEGSQGAVFLVRDELHHRDVALKVLTGPFSPQGHALFAHEFEMLAGCDHPRLPQVYDFGTTQDGTRYFTREFAPGDDLLSAAAHCDTAQQIALLIEVCRALKPLHALGLRHGDIKPQNLMTQVTRENDTTRFSVRAIDYSFSHSAIEKSPPRGTVPYMAPEFFAGEPVGLPADLYALGVIAYEMRFQQRPFSGTTEQIIAAHLHAERPDIPPAHRFRVPNDAGADADTDTPQHIALHDIIQRLLSRDPAARFPDLDELEAALSALLPAPIPPDPGERLPACGVLFQRTDLVAQVVATIDAKLQRDATASLLHVVSGQVGTDKSALLQALKWHLQLRGVHVLFGDCARQDAHTLLQDWQRQLAYIGDAQRPYPVATTRDASATHAAAMALTEPLNELAQTQSLLLICQHIDAASEEMSTALRTVFSGIDPALSVACLFSENEPGHWRELFGEAQIFDMAPLSPAQVSGLIDAYLGNATPQSAQRLWEHTMGNPSFARSILEDLALSGQGLEALTRLGPPAHLEQYWHARLQALEEHAQHLLAAVAVLDDAADVHALSAYFARSPSALQPQLDALRRDGWLVFADDRIRLGHYLLHRLMRQRPEVACHQRLHAFALQRVPANSDRALMHMAVSSDARVFAATCLPRIQQLVSTGRMGLAREVLSRALDCRKADEVPHSARRLLVEVLIHQGDLDAARPIIDDMRTQGDAATVSDADLLMARLLRTAGHNEEAIARLHQAMPTAHSDISRAALQHELAEALTATAQYEDALASTERGLELAPSHSVLAASLLGTKAKVLALCGRTAVALALSEDAVRVGVAAHSMEAEALARDIRAWILERAGRLSEAMTELETARVLYQKTGNLARLSRCLEVMGNHQYWRGQYGAMIALHEEAVRCAASVSSPLRRVQMNNVLGFSLVQVGRFQRGALVLENALREAERLQAVETQMTALTYLGDLALRQGRYENAVDLWRKAHAGFLSRGRHSLVAELELEMACALLSSNPKEHREQAAQLVAQAAARQRDDVGRDFTHRLQMAEAALLLAADNADDALVRLDALAEQTGASEHVELQWQAERLAGIALLRSGAVHLARVRLRKAQEVLNLLASRIPEAHRTAFFQDIRRAEIGQLLAQTPASSTSSLQAFSDTSSDAAPEIRALYRVLAFNRRLSRMSHIEAMLEAMLDAAIEIVGAARGLILTPQSDAPGSQTLAVRAARQMPDSDTQTPHARFSRSIAESVFLDGEPLVSVNAMDDQRFSEFLSVHEMQICSVACVPIGQDGDVLGVLYLENAAHRQLFGPRDLRVLRAFADLVALSLIQARYRSEAEQRRQELEGARRELEEMLRRQEADLAVAQHHNQGLSEQVARLRVHAEHEGDFFGLIGAGAAMQRVFALAQRIRHNDVPAVLIGESGTGKDVLARAIHDSGTRSRGAFVVLSPSTLPEPLIESTLFGHRRGAFSGAVADTPGLFAAAAQGTLYIDDVAGMSLRLQVALLRVLQEGVFTPLGATAPVQADFRLLCASHTPLETLVDRGILREDLLFRLQVIALTLPPLRQRIEDIPALARHFLKREAQRTQAMPKTLSQSAQQAMLAYAWPGNVRELAQCIQRSLIIAPQDAAIIDAKHLHIAPASAPASTPEPASAPATTPAPGSDAEAMQIRDALEKCQWNRTQAAKMLGIPRRTFYRRLKRLGLI